MSITEGLPNFRRGVMSLVILALLKREDMYGYQLVQPVVASERGRGQTEGFILRG